MPPEPNYHNRRRLSQFSAPTNRRNLTGWIPSNESVPDFADSFMRPDPGADLLAMLWPERGSRGKPPAVETSLARGIWTGWLRASRDSLPRSFGNTLAE